MRSIALGVALLTVAALAVLVFSDGTVEILGYEAVLLVAVAVALRRGKSGGIARAPDFRFSRRRPSRLPPRLVDFERLVGFSQTSLVDFDRRLLPVLVEIADARLMDVHGFTMGDRPDKAATVVGDKAWDFLRPDRELVTDVGVPGPSSVELDELLAAIESIKSESNESGVGFRP